MHNGSAITLYVLFLDTHVSIASRSTFHMEMKFFRIYAVVKLSYGQPGLSEIPLATSILDSHMAATIEALLRWLTFANGWESTDSFLRLVVVYMVEQIQKYPISAKTPPLILCPFMHATSWHVKRLFVRWPTILSTPASYDSLLCLVGQSGCALT
jgi:hypothetical protein